jgi:S-methylmethionine-dependent homocysteine/selenocysteine methylase
MAKYRSQLPQLSGGTFVTDGGLETTLIFREGIELPEFAAFVLLQNDSGLKTLRNYFHTYAELAQRYGFGLVLESPTWRANRDWGRKLGYSRKALAEANRKAIALLTDIRAGFENGQTKIVISGNIGPRGDGYIPSALMNADQATDYHFEQVRTFSETEADMIAAFTMNYVEEAIGVASAAKLVDMPVAISFTVETDGKLPTGQTLKQAIEQSDEATGNHPAYYMINCAHPTHFMDALAETGAWRSRIRGLRPNASMMSHAELNEASELDAGAPVALGQQTREVKDSLNELTVIGGCCGTDHRHIEEMCKAFAAA